MRSLIRTKQFKKDFKLSKKQGRDIEKLFEVIEKLALGKKLDQQYYDHSLHGKFKDYRECHITPDWLLIYKIEGNDLMLVRNGSHSDLFG
ncbi:MAG: type II toxin-antitoxin system mRNA interferase toxin, RelE/StbE family [Chlorobiaceae bacterium]|nr:type II toxin-antitoxin system mRNA interferase toxin, RelE/StbE family [Chlorobiaceae bacterium]